MLNNKSLSIGEVRDIINKLNWDNLECGIYSKLDFNNGKDKIILITSDINNLVGHYCLLFNDKDKNTIYFFDGSSNKPLEVFKKYHLDQNRQDANKLYDYLIKNNEIIDYNNFNFQKNKNSETCGHHCIARYYYKEMNNNDYIKFLKTIKRKYNYKNYDDLIVDIVNLIIN